MKKIIFALCALVSFETSAMAAVVVNTSTPGQTFTVNYTGKVNGSTTPLIGGSQNFTFVNTTMGGTVFNFTYSLTNTSTNASRLRAFGFNVLSALNPIAMSQGGVFPAGAFGANFPEGLGTREVCIYASTGSGNCTGGPGGLNAGQTGTGTFSLTFASAQTSITLDDFVTRFQSISPSINGSNSGVGIQTAVPEPATWLMMIFGFGLIGAAMRRRKIASPHFA
jgi:hypothetical protein